MCECKRRSSRGSSTKRVCLMSQSLPRRFVTIRYATCDVLLCSATRKQLIETEPEHASRTQLVVSKSPVVT